jgi:hypothetical protein
VAAARAVAGDAIDQAAVDTGGFRFGKLVDFRDPQFLPGGAKYLDLPGMLARAAPRPLWLAGESGDLSLVNQAYRAQNKTDQLTVFDGKESTMEVEATRWLLE